MAGSRSIWSIVAGIGVALAGLAFGSAADAQSYNAPPSVSAMDARGVNLATGKFQLPGLDIAIGASGSGIGRSVVGDSDQYSGGITEDHFQPAPPNSGYVYFLRVSYGGSVYSFVAATPSGPTNTVFATSDMYQVNGNAALSCNTAQTVIVNQTGTCTLYLADGTKVLYDTTLAPSTTQLAAIDSITKPDGEKLSLNYYYNGSTIASVKTVSSTLGWMLKYSVDGSYKLTKVAAVNTSNDYCDFTANDCNSVTGAPNVTSATVGSTTTIARNGTNVISYSVSGNTTTLTAPDGLTKTVVTAAGSDGV